MANRILIIDDDEITIALAGYRLQKAGLIVDSARDGLSAIGMMQNQFYSVVLLDILLPRLDGFGVLQYLNENHSDMRSRIIVMTPVADPHQLCVEGTFRTLRKPLDYSQLVEVVLERISSPVSSPWSYSSAEFDRGALPN